MNKSRLDQELVNRGLVISRSQAESFIKLGKIIVNGKVITKPGTLVSGKQKIEMTMGVQYVSRAGLKLASVAQVLKLDFTDKIVLDVGSSTGGFTDYALRNGAAKVIAVDVGTNQLHPSLHGHPKIELHEQTDIRNYVATRQEARGKSQDVDIIVVDVSFVSLREILPHVSKLMTHNSILVAMVKPQFEAGREQVNKGIIKNEHVRRDILKDFEDWTRKSFVILGKADSEISGSKGNHERFYLLRAIR